MLVVRAVFLFLVCSFWCVSLARAVYIDPYTNRTDITIGFVWAKYFYSSLLNANASTTLPAILYGLNTIDTIMPGRFNFTCALLYSPFDYCRLVE